MTLSMTTLIVVTANSITAVLAAALLMLVLWQAPRQRANQLFAFMMLMLGAYSTINGFARFVAPLGLKPEPVFYLATTLYALFVAGIFFFASEFVQSRTPVMRLLRWIGIGVSVGYTVALWTGSVTHSIESIDEHGSYRWHYSTFGTFASLTLLAYLIATTVVLYRTPDERGRSLWPGPALVIASATSALVIWPVVPVPLNALFLTAAAGVMGRQVLRYELFNPLANLYTQLARKNAELHEANRLKSQFLTNMSHELRTPLNSIIGYTQLVINGTYGALNDTQSDRLEKVVRNGHNLLGLINDVLDLNKIESGRIVLDRKLINTPALLNNVLTTIEPLAAQKGLALYRDFADAPPIYADDMRARQIVTNILANAIKFTHEGSVTLRGRPMSSGMVQIEIEDTGIGISQDRFDAVFAEFQQVDSSSTRQYEGTGLGMAITKKLVELHGGEIWLESTPGQGTIFYVRLPTAEPAAPQPAQSTPARRERTAAPSVLIIDDSLDALQMLTDTLHGAGYRTLTAQSGAEGLKQARARQPDVIALDIMMPGMDGWEVLRALKDEPSTRRIPVVIVSIVDNRPLAISLGASEALTKPLDRDRLLSVLDDAMTGTRTDHPILVVDDVQDDRDLIAWALDGRGHRVECVTGGPQALDWLARNEPSLIVLDLLMPSISGFDVLATIRRDDRLANVPVIVMTSKELTLEEQAFLRERCTDLVRKGYAGTDILLRAVQRGLTRTQINTLATIAENN